MGTPVITLAGKRHVERMSTSMLTAIGHQELIAATPAEYVRESVELAFDDERRVSLHSLLRGQMAESSLMDSKGLVHSLESAYRTMWHTWCANENNKTSI